MATVKFYLDTRRACGDRPMPLLISISHRGKRKLLSTGISVSPSDWDSSASAPASRSPMRARLELITGQMMQDARRIVLEMRGRSLEELAAAVAQVVNPDRHPVTEENRHELVDTVRRFAAMKRASSTRELYEGLARHLERFRPNSVFKDVTRGWLEEFDAYLSQTCRSANGRAVYMRHLRAVVNFAIDEGLTDTYAFRRFKIRTEKTAKRNLAADDLRRLLTMTVEPWQERYRDFFALSFYLIGINAKDLLLLPPQADASGRVEFNRAKTRRLYSLRVEPEAQVLINNYRGTGFLLSFMEGLRDSHKGFLRRCNHALRTLGQESRPGLPPQGEPLWPELTTYWARHSWATIAARLDIPKDTIAAALGHGAQSVTDIYIEFDRAKIDRANRAVIDYVLYGNKPKSTV